LDRPRRPAGGRPGAGPRGVRRARRTRRRPGGGDRRGRARLRYVRDTVIADFPHFLVLAARAQWEEADVDLRPDAAAWPALQPAGRARLERLIAGFCVGEAGVAEHLGPFGAAATDPVAARCFAAQEHDERRHSAFFDRVAREVLRVPGATPEERRAAL